MITAVHASRWYGQVIGVNDMSCQIGPGITALLGPNGAGKSTLIKMITGQLRPTTGTLTVFGDRPFANPSVLRRIGYCPEIDSLYDDMTGREYVRFLASLAGLSGAGRDDAVAESIEVVGMTANADRKIGGYSKGMRQRIKVAQTIVHKPELIVLDEPLNGLDPLARREMSDLFLRLGSEGRCVVVSSHILYEVEHLTRSILLMSRGRLVAQGDVYAIRSLIDSHPHRVHISADRARDLGRDLLRMNYVLSVAVGESGDSVDVETRMPDAFYAELPKVVAAGGYRLAGFNSPDNNLESVFRYLVKD